MLTRLPPKQGLYDPAFEHDSCGVGFVAHIKGKRSHQILIDAEEVLRNMDHRGACGCEPNTGDGAGILTALPHEFLQRVVRAGAEGRSCRRRGSSPPASCFLPHDAAERATCKEVVEEIIAAQGQQLVGWRKVPTQTDEGRYRPDGQAGEPASSSW